MEQNLGKTIQALLGGVTATKIAPGGIALPRSVKRKTYKQGDKTESDYLAELAALMGGTPAALPPVEMNPPVPTELPPTVMPDSEGQPLTDPNATPPLPPAPTDTQGAPQGGKPMSLDVLMGRK